MTAMTTISPIAALRRLRRAAWQPTGHVALGETVEALVVPLGALEHSWHNLCRAHEVYARSQTADTWANLSNALAAFDASLVPFFGPSGWEPPKG